MRAWRPLFVLLLFPASAFAGVPTPPWIPGAGSEVPARIVLVGTDGIQLDHQLGSFAVKVCRWGTPVNGASVMVGNSPDPLGVRLGHEAEPEQSSLSCTMPYVRTFADASGICHMTISGTVDLAAQSPGVAPTVTIFADGVSFGNIPVVCYDLDGQAGVGANDLALWMQLFGSGEEWLVADYDGSGRVDANDLSLWLTTFADGRDAVSATPLCP